MGRQDLSFTLVPYIPDSCINADRILDLARRKQTDRPGRQTDQSRVDVNQLMTWGQASASLIAILTLAGMLVKWGIVKPIKSYIDQMTYNIQPDSNGGSSLTDLHNKVNDLKDLLNDHLNDHRNTP
jgi:hypothetical protein